MKIDIIIPFYKVTKDMVTQLYNTIIQQTIISDCHIIFISDNSPNENLIINQFKNTKLNLTEKKWIEKNKKNVINVSVANANKGQTVITIASATVNDRIFLKFFFLLF